MAFQTTIACVSCGERKQVIAGARGIPTTCNECEAAERQAERDAWFAELDALPLEERVRRIEEWIYYYQAEFVAPPRY